MSFRKSTHHELNGQVKDLKAQFHEQLKGLEQRTETQIAIYHEINEFAKRRAEIEQDYAKNLEKLVKTSLVRMKNEKNKRANWNIYSACALYGQLVDDTKEEARHKTIVAEVLGNLSTASFHAKFSSMQKVLKKCREIGMLAQGEVLRVIDEMNTSMKTYQAHFEKTHAVKEEIDRLQHKMEADVKGRHKKAREKSLEKLAMKHDKAKKLCDRTRNEYILCIEAANASLHKYFADDLSDIIGCMDLGTDCWLSLLLDNIIAARKLACQAEMTALAKLSECREMSPQCDKQRFYESHSTTFMLPKRFEFRADPHETTSSIQVDGTEGDLEQRRYQMNVRLNGLRSETEKTRNDLMETEERIHRLLVAQHAIEISTDGVEDKRPPLDQLEADLDQALEAYTNGFSYFVLNANLMSRLEARSDGIGAALGLHDRNSTLPMAFDSNGVPLADWVNGGSPRAISSKFAPVSPTPQHALNVPNDQHLTASQFSEVSGSTCVIPPPPPQPNAAVMTTAALRLMNADAARGRNGVKPNELHGSTASGSPSTSTRSSAANSSNNGNASQIQHHFSQAFRRPRLFGGSLEEYCQTTGEKIPLVVTSCINALAKYAIHHQGMFRVSGAQAEINRLREAFEEGEDPLRTRTVLTANDANSIAGVLKLYLRELREPLFPFFMFERVIDCARSSNTDEFASKMVELIRKLPPSSYLLLRYLFAFLNFVSQYSEANMMDASNLAVCFGPTLLRVPDSNDQVFHQNFVNEAIKNLIIHHSRIFSSIVPGPNFQRPPLSSSAPTTPSALATAAGTNPDERVHQFADEGSTGGDSATPSTSGTIGTVSTLNDTYMRPCILGDEPNFGVTSTSLLMSNSSSASTAISRPPPITLTPRSPIEPNGMTAPAQSTPTSNFCYSSSEHSSINNFNGVHRRVPNGDEVNGVEHKPNDENAAKFSVLHRRQFSDGSAAENPLRQLSLKDENTPTAFSGLSNGTKSNSIAASKPEVHSKSGFLRHEYRTNQATSVDSAVYQPLGTQSAFTLNKSIDLNNGGSSGGRTLERLRHPVAPKAQSTSVVASSHSPPQSNGYLYSTVNKPKAPGFSTTTAVSAQVVNTMNKLDELMAAGDDAKHNDRTNAGTKN
ncbi:hypothetical protein M3Y99_00877300 [Aphelenchoides fujianensis]|nr:hypothetical protein M3Y99_00877300 [Aphelenchoides fujianensis]